MAVIHSPDSAYAKESVKWEAQYTPMGPPGRPFQYHHYPMMMHKAGRPPSGLGAPIITETTTVTDDTQYGIAKGQGFSDTPGEAVEQFHKRNTEIATLAAERNFHERRMSPAAQAEAEAANAEAVDHLPSVPETPIRRRIPVQRDAAPTAAETPKRSHHRRKVAPAATEE